MKLGKLSLLTHEMFPETQNFVILMTSNLFFSFVAHTFGVQSKKIKHTLMWERFKLMFSFMISTVLGHRFSFIF